MVSAAPAGRLPLRHPASYVSTCFGFGYFPIMPGTIGSAIAVPAAWGIHTLFGPLFGGGALFIAALLLFAIGVLSSTVYAHHLGQEDPKEVIVDEVVGQWFALVFASPAHLWQFAVGFVLFRLFDIWKPWPVNWAERYVPRGWGIMLDDVAAAIYAAAIMYGVAIFTEKPGAIEAIKAYVESLL